MVSQKDHTNPTLVHTSWVAYIFHFCYSSQSNVHCHSEKFQFKAILGYDIAPIHNVATTTTAPNNYMSREFYLDLKTHYKQMRLGQHVTYRGKLALHHQQIYCCSRFAFSFTTARHVAQVSYACGEMKVGNNKWRYTILLDKIILLFWSLRSLPHCNFFFLHRTQHIFHARGWMATNNTTLSLLGCDNVYWEKPCPFQLFIATCSSQLTMRTAGQIISWLLTKDYWLQSKASCWQPKW